MNPIDARAFRQRIQRVAPSRRRAKPPGVTDRSRIKTDSELSALFHTFNQTVARTKPFTREWGDAVFSVNNILRERIRRAVVPSPS
jgi:hypothetical protein